MIPAGKAKFQRECMRTAKIGPDLRLAATELFGLKSWFSCLSESVFKSMSHLILQDLLSCWAIIKMGNI